MTGSPSSFALRGRILRAGRAWGRLAEIPGVRFWRGISPRYVGSGPLRPSGSARYVPPSRKLRPADMQSRVDELTNTGSKGCCRRWRAVPVSRGRAGPPMCLARARRKDCSLSAAWRIGTGTLCRRTGPIPGVPQRHRHSPTEGLCRFHESRHRVLVRTGSSMSIRCIEIRTLSAGPASRRRLP